MALQACADHDALIKPKNTLLPLLSPYHSTPSLFMHPSKSFLNVVKVPASTTSPGISFQSHTTLRENNIPRPSPLHIPLFTFKLCPLLIDVSTPLTIHAVCASHNCVDLYQFSPQPLSYQWKQS